MIRDARWLSHDAYFTPGAAAEQHLRAVAALGVDPEVVIDIGAGAGVYLQRARAVWPRARLVAVEVRPEEGEHLQRWADDVVLLSFDDPRTAVALGPGGPRELVIGNFPFSRAAAIVQWARPRGGVVSSLLPAGFGDDDEAEELLHVDPPSHAFRLTGGRIGFLGPGKDFQHHEALLWRGPARPGGAWATRPLPPLPQHLRGWHVRPGTERAFAPLPSHLYPAIGGPLG